MRPGAGHPGVWVADGTPPAPGTNCRRPPLAWPSASTPPSRHVGPPTWDRPSYEIQGASHEPVGHLSFGDDPSAGRLDLDHSVDRLFRILKHRTQQPIRVRL